jgi:diguanylate cyclase (GGDEF)-like protein
MVEDGRTVVEGDVPKLDQPADPFSGVLASCEQVNTLMKECAEGLSMVNNAIVQARAEPGSLPGIEGVLEKTVAILNTVRAASAVLSLMHQALKMAGRERSLVQHQFAAAQEQEQSSRQAAFHDALTGLPNRALFDDRLEHGLAEAKRHGWTLAVMFVDLDQFKVVNDSLGHDAGDRVLQAVARRLRENTRGEDTISRHGGDEFLCLLMDVGDEKSVAMIAGKLIQAIQVPCRVSVGGTEIDAPVSASIGISIFPKDGTTADALVKKADETMYRAKRAGSGYLFAQ